jgi:hypothetical protein
VDDLLKAYFQRALSGPEEERLTRLLAEDEDAAVRFAELARQEHEASALARPRGRHGLAWLLGAALLGAGLAWAFWPASAPRPAVLKVDKEVDEFEALATPAPERPTAPAPDAAAAPLPPPDRLQVHRQGADYVLTLDTRRPGGATLELCTVEGRLLRVLYQGPLKAGSVALRWDCAGQDGQALAPGRYKLRLTRDDGSTLARTVDVSAR